MSRPGKTSMGNSIGDRVEDMKEWVSEHTKIVMPVILLICVLITVIVAVNANKRAAEEVEVQIADVVTETESAEENEEIIQIELEENAYPAVNTLISNYYEALASGDIDTVVSINAFIENKEKIWIQEMSKYIESYPELTVYTKPGPVEDSYLVFVYYKLKFTEYDRLVPGMKALYVCTDENGNCYINEGEENTIVTNYIRDVSLQDDVVDLNNRISVEYNELVENDDELKAFLADLQNRVEVSVGVTLAKMEAQESTDSEEAAEESGTNNEDNSAAQSEETVEETQPVKTVKKVRATDVVNIRSSDSETADKVGKAQINDEFTLIEEKGNGWSKVSFENKDAFIKSEYLEVVSEEVVEETAQEVPAANETVQAETASAKDAQTVTVIENVNVRKSASENGEKLGLVYIGEKLELVMKQADGWTKIKYKGQTAYVKSDYVE